VIAELLVLFTVDTCCLTFQQNATSAALEDDEIREENQGNIVKSVLQAKLQRLAILIGYFGTPRYLPTVLAASYHRRRLQYGNQCTKFEISRFTRYKAMNGRAKCRKWGGLGWLRSTQGIGQCHHLIEHIRIPIPDRWQFLLGVKVKGARLVCTRLLS